MIAKFLWEDKVSVKSELVFKNPTMLGTAIPDLGADVPEGEHLVSIEISLDG